MNTDRPLRRFTTPSDLNIPDVRDGLTRLERTILFVLHELRKEYGERHVPTVLVFGRVVELLDVSIDEFTLGLESAMAKKNPGDVRGDWINASRS